MNSPFCKVVLFCLCSLLSIKAAFASARIPHEDSRVIQSFDTDWRFLKADAEGAERADYNDTAWRQLDIPHDWSIEGPFHENELTGGAGGFLPAGLGWYRRHFILPADFVHKKISIEFDGVMANSDVWINGFHLGHRPNGFVSFAYDLTGHLHFGAVPNLIAVRADNAPQPASRWYAGAGIYRHVRLVVTDLVQIETNSIFITTPMITADHATISVQGVIANHSPTSRKLSLRIALYNPDGLEIQTVDTELPSIEADQTLPFKQQINLSTPQRWDIDHPVLYRADVEIREKRTALDGIVTRFGIRDFHFEADTGFWLNGKNVKMKGVCLHEDVSAFGTAVPRSALARRLRALKDIGVNALRTAHNPPSPELLDLCDELGFVVMDELFDCWTVAKNPYDYHLYFNDWSKIDVQATVLRDRNHPSIVLYSAGNEIHDTPDAKKSKTILIELLKAFHENDPTRPVTQGLFRPNVSHDYDDGLADLLDVIGTNYRFNEILAAHAVKPTRKIIGTENKHDLASWLAVRDNAPYAGEFIWTGADYLGESDAWPYIASGSGLIDRTDLTHGDGDVFRSWWATHPVISVARRIAPAHVPEGDPGFIPLRQRQALFSDWTPRDLGPHEETVEVNSNCETVELYLNGKSLGSQVLTKELTPRMWKVGFAPGTLKAVGRNGAKQVAEQTLRTSGKPTHIILKADHSSLFPSWDEVDYIEANVVDDHGVLASDANDLISFTLSGPGVMAAVDSADNASHESFQTTNRHAFQGRCFVIIRASSTSGQITVTASAAGLAKGKTSVKAIDSAYR